MVDNEENITLADIENHETNKYKKNINDLIENAEIEAEMEAEKNIRSKNSRIFLISMIGFVLLSLVYLKINNQSAEKVTPYEKLSAPIQTPIKSPEVKLAKQATIVEESNSPIPFHQIKKVKSFVETVQVTPEKKPDSIIKTTINSKPQKKTISEKINLKEKNRITQPIRTKNTFFVQAGAFSLEQNANTLVNKLKAKDFTPLINVVSNGQKKTYLVQLGVFPSKEKALLVQGKLARIGYPKTIIK